VADPKTPSNNPVHDRDGDGFIEPRHTTTPAQAKRVPATLEVGDSGLRRYGGWVREEFMTRLQGLAGIKKYQEMSDNDDTVGGVLTAFETLLRQTDWTFEAVDESAEAIAGKEFLEECLTDMELGLTDVMSEISTMFSFGFAPMEIVYKIRRGDNPKDLRYHSRYDDGKVGLRKLALRAQNSVDMWDFTPDGYVRGLWQMTQDGVRAYIPINRLLLFRTTTVANNPEGKSLLRRSYRSWYFKTRIQEIEAMGVERDLAGIPIMRIPSEYMRADADDDHKSIYATYKDIVGKIVRDENEGLVLPSDRDDAGNLRVEFELLKGGSSRQFNTNEIINRYNLAIAMSVLADFVLLGHKAVGSFALSDNKTELFKVSLGAYLDSIEEVFNRELTPQLWRLNGMDISTMPRLVHEEVDTPSVEVLGTFLRNLTQAGLTGDVDRDFINAIRGYANLPLQDEELPEDLRYPNQTPEPEIGVGESESGGSVAKLQKQVRQLSSAFESVETGLSELLQKGEET